MNSTDSNADHAFFYNVRLGFVFMKWCQQEGDEIKGVPVFMSGEDGQVN